MSNHPFNSRKADIPNPSMVNFPFSNGYRISYFGPRNVVTFYEKHPLWDQEPLFKKCAKIIRDYFSRRLLFCIFFEVTIKIYIYTSGIYIIYIYHFEPLVHVLFFFSLQVPGSDARVSQTSAKNWRFTSHRLTIPYEKRSDASKEMSIPYEWPMLSVSHGTFPWKICSIDLLS